MLGPALFTISLRMESAKVDFPRNFGEMYGQGEFCWVY